MKAIVYDQYGPPEVLQLVDLEKPVPNDNQILVKVEAVSANPAEAHLRSGMLLGRLMGGQGLLKPKTRVLYGADFAGRVAAAGKNITHYQVGDEVFGRRDPGGFAEYVAVSEKPVAHKPANISFEEAAAVPVAGITALQALRDSGQLQAGQKVLINGAAGGVGTFSVQIAKALGAEVTAVCSTRNTALVTSLGADQVVDYTREDVMRSGETFDLVLDNAGTLTVSQDLRLLKPNGRAVIVGFGGVGKLIGQQVMSRLVSRRGGKQVGSMLAKLNPQDMALLAEMMAGGRVKPVVERVFSLREVAEAYRYMETKHASGKIVIKTDW